MYVLFEENTQNFFLEERKMRSRVFLTILFLMLGVCSSEVMGVEIARYTFEGNTNDSVGSFHATIVTTTGYPAIVTEAERGSVLELDAAAGYIEYPEWVPLDPGIVEFSYAYWLKQHSPLSGSAHSVIANTTWSAGSVHFDVMNNAPKLGINGILPGGNLTGDADSLLADVWYHVAFTKSETHLILYVDGEPVATRTPLTNVPPLVCFLGPARSEWNGARHFDAYIDDVRIFNHALTEEEIQAVMAGGGAGYGQTGCRCRAGSGVHHAGSRHSRRVYSG